MGNDLVMTHNVTGSSQIMEDDCYWSPTLELVNFLFPKIPFRTLDTGATLRSIQSGLIDIKVDVFLTERKSDELRTGFGVAKTCVVPGDMHWCH